MQGNPGEHPCYLMTVTFTILSGLTPGAGLEGSMGWIFCTTCIVRIVFGAIEQTLRRRGD